MKFSSRSSNRRGSSIPRIGVWKSTFAVLSTVPSTDFHSMNRSSFAVIVPARVSAMSLMMQNAL